MVKHLLKRFAARLGVQVRRAPDAALPFIHTVEFEDSSFQLWIVSEHTKSWWHRPRLEMDSERRFLKEMCPPGGIAFDVGAHHGITLIPLARWLGKSGQVHAFEANAENALVLQANAGLNHLQNCQCVYAAVGAAAGEVTVDGETVAGGGRTVPVVALDQYCQERGISRVDLLKIDVEGFELQVLQGARGLLAAGANLDLELHLDELARYGASAAGVFELLDISRYQLSMMTRPDWQHEKPVTGLQDLPAHGVVNLFCRWRGHAGNGLSAG